MILLVLMTVMLLLPSACYAQTTEDLYSPGNVLLFADHLYCESDYERAAFEYKRYLERGESDTVKFKLALSLYSASIYDSAAFYFSSVPLSSSMNRDAALYETAALYLNNDFPAFESAVKQNELPENIKLYNTALLLNGKAPDKNIFLNLYEEPVKSEAEIIYNNIMVPEYKSPITAGILSALIPGLGKIYTGDYGDGITAFLAVGLLSYLSYTNFKAEHDVRAWIFAGTGALFYAGSIYGSAASASLFNARIDLDAASDAAEFLKKHNYFLPVLDICGN